MAEIEMETNGLEIEVDPGDQVTIEIEEQPVDDIQFLLDNIQSPNIAEDIDEDTLTLLAQQVCEDYQRDDESMSDWADMVEFGQDLAKQERYGKSEPWDGASNFKTPAVFSASIAFGDRATTELIRARDLVKSDVIGNDESGAKREAAKRVAEYSNWQINHEMVDWREKQQSLLYELPATGTVFKKTYFDTLTGKNRSEVIQYPNFVVNQATKSMEDCETFTHIIDVSYNQLLERQRAGIWLDVDIYGMNPESDEGSNEEQDVEQAFDNEQRFLEQNCWFDLDGDGYAEPYCVTVHQAKGKVVRIVARYDETSIYVSDMPGVVRKLIPGELTEGLNLVRIESINDIVKYGFIDDPCGGFLCLGYYHILSSLARAINATANQLIDSGTLANTQGGFLAKGFRKKMGNLRVKPGEWVSTDIGAADLANGVQPHKFKEPSPTLLQLNELNKKELADLSVNMDLNGVIAPNAPATTTLALMQEAMLPASARLQSINRSMSKEFMALFRLNAKYIDPRQYQRVLDDESANYEVDFNIADQNLLPTANPEMSSRMQRITQAEALMEPTRFQLLQMAGADTKPIIDTWLDAIGLDDLEGQLFPSQEEMDEQQKARIQAQQDRQRKQDQLTAIQIDQSERDLVRREEESEAKIIKDNASALASLADVDLKRAEIVLKLEQAESENLKNQITTYTAELEVITGMRDDLRKQLEEKAKNDIRQISGTTGSGAPNAEPQRGANPQLALAPSN